MRGDGVEHIRGIYECKLVTRQFYRLWCRSFFEHTVCTFADVVVGSQQGLWGLSISVLI